MFFSSIFLRSTMEKKDEIQQLLGTYFKQKPVNKAFLFGSYARGNADVNSDIDILVELDYTKPIGLEFVQMQIELQNILHKKVDLVTLRGVSKRIMPLVEKDKVLIYAR